MHNDLLLFATITMGLLTAFVGGYIARRLGLPTLVGYLLAGLAIGPFTPGFVGDTGDISQLAEMGVIFMMFGVGLHFSLKDLWSVRTIAVPGALLQTLFATILGILLTQLWGWTLAASVVLGLAISVASTVVLLRGLADNGLSSTAHGKVAIGWLVFEDLFTVVILVLMPAVLADTGANPLESLALALIKTSVFVALMLFLGAKVMPWLLMRIAHMRSRELFILAVVALALGTAFGAAELFGVSLALGAFLAGVIISESDISHQVGAEIVPFRDLFAVLFFVSVGMLVDPAYVLANFGQVLALTVLVVFGKALIALLLSLILPGAGRTMIVVAAGLSQIGEFSFIVGQAGVALGVLSREQYGLILAASVLSILVNPAMFKTIPTLERALERVRPLWRRMNTGGPTPEPLHVSLRDHVVIVGVGRVGMHISRVLEALHFPFLVVEADAAQTTRMQALGIKTLFGDAANSEILTHAGLENARALVVTVSNEATAELVVAAARDIAPHLPIIARAGTISGLERLASHGANDIIHPELEGGLEIVRHVLLRLEYPTGQIQKYVDSVRQDAYESASASGQPHHVLDQLVAAVRGVEIAWHQVTPGSTIIGQSLAEANLRQRIGTSVIALMRGDKVLPNPKSDARFQEGDMVGLIGSPEELAEAEQIISPGAVVTQQD